MPNDATTILGVSETVFRLSIFLSAFVLFSVLETWRPRRARLQTRVQRWTTNAGMLVISTLLVRVLVLVAPLLAMTTGAALAGELGWGFLNLVVLPSWLEILIAIVLLDFALWLQHVITHKVPVLWRFHRVHHADRDLDASSALRFHPIEIAFSATFKLAVVVLLGPAILAAVVFEVILNAGAMFNHANLSIPRRVDCALRAFIVTPDMHRVHHSVHRRDHDTNYGFCLSLWDRLFGTYTREPSEGHAGMTIGLTPYQTPDTQRLGWSLFLPFK